MNEFFEGNMKRCNPSIRSTFFDPSKTSSKKCIVRYAEEQRNHKAVSNIDENEIWARCHVAPKSQQYFVSNYGRVKVTRPSFERLLKFGMVNGYYTIAWPGQGKRKTYLLHRVVARHFVENPHDYSIVDHIDGNRGNNNANNLRWVKDLSQNILNPVTHAKMIHPAPIVQIQMQTNKVIKHWKDANSIFKALNYHSSNILQCCRGKAKSAYGYMWKFANDKSLV